LTWWVSQAAILDALAVDGQNIDIETKAMTIAEYKSFLIFGVSLLVGYC
jgi:hypothetical protein